MNFLIIPFWDIGESSIDLLQPDVRSGLSNTIIIFNETKDNTTVILTKKIMRIFKKNNNNNNIYIEQNFININGIEQETEWEDIESFYFFRDLGLFICPKGKYFLNSYSNYEFQEIIPESFDTSNIDENDWELKCFYQPEHNILFYALLNLKLYSKYNIFSYDLYPSRKIIPIRKHYGKICEIVYDFIWANKSVNYKNYNMFAIIDNGAEFQLNLLNTAIEGTKFYYDEINSYQIDYRSNYFNAYFENNQNNNYFYWFAANTTSEFHSGFSSNPINIDSINYRNIHIIKNYDSPFKFLYWNKTKIKKINIIRNTRFIYYEIEYNKTKQETYYGIIDIEWNQIIFNTNEKIIEFKPLKDYSLLAFTETTVYEICAIKENGKCVDRCSFGEIILDTERGNYCNESQICTNYILIPDNICIKDCDKTVFASQQNKCGLCKYINPQRKYKHINGSCLPYLLPSTYYINQDMLVYDFCNSDCQSCSNGEECDECLNEYEKVDRKCIMKCHSNCLNCSEYSEDDKEQKCLSCKDNMFFNEKEGNCFCLKGYYENNDNICLKCHENCETCSKGPEKNNDTENQNCDSCNSNMKYLVNAKGFNKNCVNNCPVGTILKDNYCILKEDKKNYSYIYVILFALIIIVFTFIIFKFIHENKKQRSSEKIADGITERLGGESRDLALM